MFIEGMGVVRLATTVPITQCIYYDCKSTSEIGSGTCSACCVLSQLQSLPPHMGGRETAMQCKAYPWQTTFIKQHSGSALLLQLCMASLSL